MAYAGYKKLHALIVDDFDSFRMTVSKMLQEMGVNSIDTASNGAEALRLCKAKMYDLILCDHNLGKGKTGQQVLEDLRYHKILDPTAVFILISAESSRSMVMAAYDSEPDEYLAKPITTRSLQRRLDRLMARRDKLTPVYRAINGKQFDVAIQLCRKEVASDGRFAAHCQKMLGHLYLEMGDVDAAEALYREALEHRSLDWAMVGMAEVKRARGDLLGAQQWLEETVQEHPLFMKAYDLQAQICREQGARDRLQKVLEHAVEVSPLAILRQQTLAETAMENHDVVTAATAYRKAVRLGENSVYDRADVHLDFARATATLFAEDKTLAKQYARDALKTLSDYEQRFGKQIDRKAEALLIEAQIAAGQGDKKLAEQLLEQTQSLLADEGLVLSLDASLELAKTYRATDRATEASELLEELTSLHAGQERDLEKIDRLLEEPVSHKNRQLVAEINQRGISFYEQQQYRDSIECFDEALRKFPRHIGVRLNLAQALLDKIDREGAHESDLAKVSVTLQFVTDTILPNHEQFRRFRQLQDLHRQVENKVKIGS
ncbi:MULTISPECIES: tetratricopeptide repeat-containing response regulator [unclassified Marinimicrobium]|jgi:CheY-like chemotaxis protein/cytochrome c-type biogenesis protein CcmH/NrfG|uniref:tetratricopeptide repeat-containing response regulator n=1 Tax=unclassified Marinimicrobium TaxID=2632100 RepID=UPI0025809956|nr:MULTISPECIES: tetratricopeptide repeat-containing response regulator [unclassified Marinimicrobium]